MTMINIQRYSVYPRTSLEGIPEDFLKWAEAVHGWTRDVLLKLGSAAFGTRGRGNALDELVERYLRLKNLRAGCSSCDDQAAPHTFYGGLVHYCATCLPHTSNDVAAFMKDDEQIATGLSRW